MAQDSAASKTIGAKPPKRQKPTWRNVATATEGLQPGQKKDEKLQLVVQLDRNISLDVWNIAEVFDKCRDFNHQLD